MNASTCTPQPVQFQKRRNPNDVHVPKYAVSTTDEVEAMLSADCVVAIGVSGGKDSQATAIRLTAYLDEIGHSGPRLLIHSDLGMVEWKESLPVSERLAKRVGLDLIVVRRKSGGMMERWEQRWSDNVARYVNLNTVKLILPWSNSQFKFCTGELKGDPISAALKKRYPGQKILSVTGVRHDESSRRATMPTASRNSKLSKRKITGVNWNPIITWSTPDVYSYLEEQNEPLHEAYTTYGSTRVSCSFCVLGSISDLKASASCPDHADVYRRMVQLEIDSTFSFQGSRWLGDIAPELLTETMLSQLLLSKQKAQLRIDAEARLPKHLLYSEGWPRSIPTFDEAALIADVRRQVAGIMGLELMYTDAASVVSRYQELIQLGLDKAQSNAKKKARAS